MDSRGFSTEVLKQQELTSSAQTRRSSSGRGFTRHVAGFLARHAECALSMIRSSREFERLVALIEGTLCPQGAVVKSPDFLLDRTTGKRRQVDVSIRMNVGSVPVLVIVECRKRSRAQDVTWIEQLAQKRNDLGAAKAVAVSLGGFSEAAQRKAASHSIETRGLGNIGASEIRSWFTAGHLHLFVRRVDIHRVSVDLDPNAPEDVKLDPRVAATLADSPSTDTPLFVEKAQGKHWSVSEIFMDQAARHDFYAGVSEDGTKFHRPLELKFPNANVRYQIHTTCGLVDVVKMTLFAELWIEKIRVPPSVLSYADARQDLAQLVEYPIDLHKEKYVLSLVRDAASGVVTTYLRRAVN